MFAPLSHKKEYATVAYSTVAYSREPLNNEQHIFARANFAESHPF
jgi:hypothetical protein